MKTGVRSRGPFELEIEYFHGDIQRHHLIGGLEVAVHDAAVVRSLERLNHLQRYGS